MGTIFDLSGNRQILAANQNCFPAPIKHPSRMLHEHVISYVLNGGWELSIGSKVIHPTKDFVFIQPAHIAHTGLTLCPSGTTTMFVHFSVEEGDRMTQEEPSLLPDKSVYIGNLIDASANPEIKRLLIKIIESYNRREHLKGAAHLNLLLCELSDSATSAGTDYAVKIKRILDNDIRQNLSNRNIAEQLNISVRTAECHFRAQYHTGIHQYVLTQRIEQAKFWLEYYPEIKLMNLARDLGFYDEYHFSRQFKKETGYSPKQYRKHVLSGKNIP